MHANAHAINYHKTLNTAILGKIHKKIKNSHKLLGVRETAD